MSRPKKCLTRKQLVLRRSLLLLPLLLFVLSFYNLFPSQVVREMEISRSTGQTSILEKRKFGSTVFYLSSNESTLMLTICQFHPLYGWMDHGCTSLDLSQEDSPVHAVGVYLYDNERRYIHVFGYVDMENAASVHFYNPYKGPSSFEIEAPLVQDESGVFRFEGSMEEPEGDIGVPYTVDVLDHSRNVLYTYDCTYHWCGGPLS